MSLVSIDDLAYTLKKGKESGQRAIVFLGAGASKTGGIPLAGELMTEILERYAEAPAVRRLSPEDKKSYTKVMAALHPVDRKALFKSYIDGASINASHIYLAHMMAEGFIDFVFTVNFDNLMQRALGLFNMYPAVYDMAMLKGMTTAPFESPGLVYLHGQYHGFSLLNTEQEFRSVSELLKRSFFTVANRPWILVGYSGEDPVLEYINDLGRFDHGLYWICYQDKDPSERVSNCLFSDIDKNAFKLKGCNADGFFVKLHAELNLPQPPIINTPFSYLRGLQDGLVDIKGDELKMATERLNITKGWLNDAIEIYEEADGSTEPDKHKIELEKAHKTLFDLIITEKYEKLPDFDKYESNPMFMSDLSIGYNNWGISLNKLGRASNGEEAITYLKESLEKYKRATSLNPDYAAAYNNWGSSLGILGNLLVGEEAIAYTKEAGKKCEQAISLKPDYSLAYYNWGISLNKLGRASNGEEAITYFKQAIEKYERAANLTPENGDVYSNWGTALHNLGQKIEGEETIFYLIQAAEKYERAANLKPEDSAVYNNWGNILDDLGQQAKGEEAITYFKQSTEKYERAASLAPDDGDVYDNWSAALLRLYHQSPEIEKNTILSQALTVAEKACSLSGDSYNLSCAYALLNDSFNAFKYLEQALRNEEISFSHVIEDNDWDHLRNNAKYIKLENQYNINQEIAQ